MGFFSRSRSHLFEVDPALGLESLTVRVVASLFVSEKGHGRRWFLISPPPPGALPALFLLFLLLGAEQKRTRAHC